MEHPPIISVTADIVAAHVANNIVSARDLPELIRNVHEALAALGAPIVHPPARKVPAVSARASVKPDHLVCLECGGKHKMLRRHLSRAHGLTPQQYRADYDLPANYPTTAPKYSALRSEMARASGLGRRPGESGESSPGGRRRKASRT